MALLINSLLAVPTAPSLLSPAAAGLGLGIALAGAPGPVQAIILSETIRGGMARGVRVQVGANLTFAVLLVCLAFGLAVVAPTGVALRILKIVGGLFLLWLAVDGFRGAAVADPSAAARSRLPPAVRGIFAVVLNPGAWLFLATAASSLFSAAAHTNGQAGALLAAATLSIGLSAGDGAVVLIGGLGVRRAGARVGLWVQRVLAVVLGVLGVGLIISAVVA